MPRHTYKPDAVDNARSLRQSASTPERVLWSHLRSRGLAGIKFRRQYPVGPYVVDFYCAAATLAVELDGARHADRREHDEQRDAFLHGQGVSVLRFSVSEFMSNPDGVLIAIRDRCFERMHKDPHPNPLPRGEGAGARVALHHPLPRGEGVGGAM